MSSPTVRLLDVTRSFAGVPALHTVSFEAPPGAITVLLGPNGAGKTTAIRLITGALGPDSGIVRVFDGDPTTVAGEAIRRRCGVVSAKPSLYDRLSGWDNLRYAAELYGVGRGNDADARIRASAERFGIANSLDDQVGGYSTGMKTRLALARSVIHEPDLLLLDEPTSGLDPESAAAVLELIRAMAAEGQTVIMCTHLLLEAEGLADRIVMMEQGEVVESGSPIDLAANFWPRPIVTFVAASGDSLDALATADGVVAFEDRGTRASLTLDHAARVPDLIARCCEVGIRLDAVIPYEPSLEDLYFAIRARSRGPEDAERRTTELQEASS